MPIEFDPALAREGAVQLPLGAEVIELVGPLTLVDPLTHDLVVRLVRDIRPDLVEECGSILAALRSAGWLAPNRGLGRPGLPSARWSWSGPQRAALRSAFMATFPERVRRSHEIVADWYCQQDRPWLALRHLVQVRSWLRLAAVITEHWTLLLARYPNALARSLGAMPVAAIVRHPPLAALNEILGGAPLTPLPLPRLLDEPERAMVSDSGRAREVLEANLAAMVVLRRRGDYRRAKAYSEQLNEIQRTAIAHRTPETSGLGALVLVESAILSQLTGDAAEASAQLRDANRYLTSSEFWFSTAEIPARMAFSLAVLGDMRRSTTWLDRAGDTTPAMGRRTRHVAGSIALARAMVAGGQLDREQMAHALEQLGPDLNAGEYWPFALAARARYAVLWGDAESMVTCLAAVRAKRAEQSAPSAPSTPRAGGVSTGVSGPQLAETEAGLLFALGRSNELWAVLNGRYAQHPLLQAQRARMALLADDMSGARDLAHALAYRPITLTPLQRVEVTLINAVVAHRQGEARQAVDALRRALHEADVLGVLAPFATVPLVDLKAIGSSLAEAHFVLDDERLALVSPATGTVATPASLSKREQLILGGLARGWPAARIASELSVSINTVRSQRRSLYRKLGASSRIQALRIASEQGLTNGHPM